MNRILIRVYVPLLEKKYDIWVPINKRIYNVIDNIIKGINSMNKIEYNIIRFPNLYNKENTEIYEYNARIIDTDIRNGTELILF